MDNERGNNRILDLKYVVIIILYWQFKFINSYIINKKTLKFCTCESI